jgi:hypothetical protein
VYTQQDKTQTKNRIIKYSVIAGVIEAVLIAEIVMCLIYRWEVLTSVTAAAMFIVVCFMWLMFIWPCIRYLLFLKDMAAGIGRELTGSVVEISAQEEMQDGVRVLPMRFFLESEQDERIVYLNATKSEFFPKAGQQVTLKCFGRHVKEVV